MKLTSWNVNGIRASLGKGRREYMLNGDADVICLQETKAQQEQVDQPPHSSTPAPVLTVPGAAGATANSKQILTGGRWCGIVVGISFSLGKLFSIRYASKTVGSREWRSVATPQRAIG